MFLSKHNGTRSISVDSLTLTRSRRIFSSLVELQYTAVFRLFCFNWVQKVNIEKNSGRLLVKMRDELFLSTNFLVSFMQMYFQHCQWILNVSRIMFTSSTCTNEIKLCLQYATQYIQCDSRALDFGRICSRWMYVLTVKQQHAISSTVCWRNWP